MSALPTRLPQPRIPYGELAPVLRPLLAPLLDALSLPPHARALEAGSSGGLLTSLLAETQLASGLATVDFADPAPDTLEAAISRSPAWPWRAHFLNHSLLQLAPRDAYHLILTWQCFSQPDQLDRFAHAVAGCQRRSGWLITCHDHQEPAALAFALHPYKLHQTQHYPVSGGRLTKTLSLWEYAS